MNTRVRSRFTLLELLVVVSIIAVLAAVLLPAIRKAKATADSTKCVNNLKMIIGASTLYSDAHDEWIIPSVNSWNWAYWIGNGAGGFGLNNDYYLPGRYPEVAICPSSPLNVAADYAPVKYAMNELVSPNSVPASASAVRRPRILVSERVLAVFDAGPWTGDPTLSYASTAGVGHVGYWHGTWANLAAFDGHVGSVRRADSSSPNYWDLDFDLANYSFEYE